MARDEVVSSAAQFLQDPETGSAPMNKRIQFLKAQNLTQEEIDLALARAGQVPIGLSPQLPQDVPSYASQPRQDFRRQPPAPYNYNPYADWSPPSAAPTPTGPFRRDWRDWFIMATVASGASFALYTIAQRYIRPLIAPPTTPQIEKDKAAIDEQFSRAFALMDTLQEDTAALKRAEETRNERLDKALGEVESVLAELKISSKKREDDSTKISDEVQSLKRSIPKTLDSVRDSNEKGLKDLTFELASLRSLVSIRPETNVPSTAAPGNETASSNPTTTDGLPNLISASNYPEPTSTPITKVREAVNNGVESDSRSDSVASPPDPNPWSRYTALASKSGQYGATDRAAIPSWQTSMTRDQAPETGGAKGGSSQTAAQ